MWEVLQCWGKVDGVIARATKVGWSGGPASKNEASSIVSSSSHRDRGEEEDMFEIESGGEDWGFDMVGLLNYIRRDPLRHRW